MKIIFLVLVLCSNTYPKNTLTSEDIFKDITIDKIIKTNPLKEEKIYFDKNETGYMFIDKDKDLAEDRLEKYLNESKEYNTISKLYMFQELYLYDYFVNQCKEQRVSKKCLKILHSLGQFKLHNICRKELKKKLKISPIFKDILAQNGKSDVVRSMIRSIHKQIPVEQYSSDEQFLFVIPGLNCFQRIERWNLF